MEHRFDIDRIARIAGRIMVAYKPGKVMLMLAKGISGKDVTNADLQSMSRSDDPAQKSIFDKTQESLDSLQKEVATWATFNGKEDPLFRDLLWSGIENGDGPIKIGPVGVVDINNDDCDKMKDRWIDYLDLCNKQQVQKEISTLRRKIEQKQVTISEFAELLDQIKEKYKSMVKKNHLTSGSDDAWDELDRKKWTVDGYDVYKITSFSTMAAVAGEDPVTKKDKTEWCVSHESSYFKHYGPPYYLFAKNHECVCLAHIGSGQINDIRNSPVHDKSLLNTVGKFFKDVIKADISDPRGTFREIPGIRDYAEMIRQADRKDLHENEMDEMASSETAAIRKHIAMNERTPAEILEKLAEDPDDDVREQAALNKNLPFKTAAKLANDPVAAVRESVASRSDITPEVAEKLSEDDEAIVKVALCENPTIPVEMFEKLAGRDEKIKLYLTRNEKLPAETLKRIVETTGNMYVLRSVCMHRNATPEVLRKALENKALTGAVKSKVQERLDKMEGKSRRY